MSGWALTRANVTAWNATALADLAGAIVGGNATYEYQIDRGPQHFANLNGAWSGRAYDAAYNRVGEDHWQAKKIKEEVTDLVDLLNQAASRLATEKSVLLGKVADAEDPAFTIAGETLTVSDVWKVTATYPPKVTADDRRKIDDRVASEQGLVNSAFYSLRDAAAQFDQAIRTAAQQIRDAGSNFGDGVDAPVVPGTVIPAPGSSEARTVASAAAFEGMFGRPPVTDIDWATAKSLNPNSYDPKYQGLPPEIRVVKIQPQPGQGLVRTSHFIEQRDVSNPQWNNPLGRDRGDDRGADPHFDPEHARVTTYVDYENGIVVMRQNPSVVQNADGSPGEVRVAAPDGEVWQADDGSVRVKYNAGNPFAPELAADPPILNSDNTTLDTGDHKLTVNGDLVFTPGRDGVTINGTRTDYPSLEAYQDRPDGSTRTIAVDPAVTGRSWGPAVNLPFHHDIGNPDNAFPKFHDWNYDYDVPGNPKPSTPFGPVADPPGVPLPKGMI
ncbi:WXG100 family type VII secretion target [Nocardia sp. NPDC050406]|uniref:WXG100 family type VII secretion target n=1 Tax=Nocardia sp. NPDC050406 TaxID=3364318 RepID=UPI003793D852